MRTFSAAVAVLVLLVGHAAGSPLELATINGAQLPEKSASSDKQASKAGISPHLIKAQILLDRVRFSPGEIDGKPGTNLDKAIAAFAAAKGLQTPAGLNQQVWKALTATSQELGGQGIHYLRRGSARAVRRQHPFQLGGDEGPAGAGLHRPSRAARREIPHERGAAHRAKSGA